MAERLLCFMVTSAVGLSVHWVFVEQAAAVVMVAAAVCVVEE